MVKLAGIFGKFQPIKALLIGDFMLDKYTTGTIKRISPEAPVSVLHVEKDHSLPGGAGNVVLNLLSLKAEVTAIGRVGRDKDGEDLIHSLKKEGANVDHILFQEDYPTPIKNRLIASSQQVIRIDKEKICPLDKNLEDSLIKKLSKLIRDKQVVALSDYGKGFLSNRLIEAVALTCRKFKVPLIVDPKGIDFSKYRHANIIKPNLSEAYAAANLSSHEPLEKVAEVLFKITSADKLVVTRSENGITLFDKKRKDFPVRSKEVKDVTGAGDTVLAMIAACIGNGFDIEEAMHLSNIAAGIAIEHLGCARVSLSDLAKRLLEIDADNKIFEESHLFALKEVLRDKKFSVLVLDSKEGMSTALFKAIFKLSKDNSKLIVYLKDSRPDQDFISLVSSLSLIDYIILKQKSGFFEKLKPKAIFEIAKGELQKMDSRK